MPGCSRTLRRRTALLALALSVAIATPAPAAAQEGAPSLRIAIPAYDGSLTPYTFESGYAFMSLVYDTLMWRDTHGVAQPWLARSVRRNPTRRTVTVRLREGVRWHDGRPLTADDVVFTYRYMARRSHPRFTTQLRDIAGVEAIDPLTVTFRLRRRAPGFVDQPLADVPILPRHLWSGLAAERRAPPGLPVGTGPYRLTSHSREDGYRFARNRDYFRGVPSVARIVVPIVSLEASVTTELRRRRVDVVPLTVAPGSRKRRLPGVTFSDAISYTGTMLLFNVARQPFRRLAARQAVARALDIVTIAGNASGVAGGPLPAIRGMLHPASPWAPRSLRHRVDERAARLAFAEEGIGPFRVAVANNDPVRLEAATRVVRALRRLGAGARLAELSPGALDRALGRRKRRATFDVAVTGIPALASYDPAFLRAIFGDPRTEPLNDGNYRSAAFDAAAEEVANARNLRARRFAVERELALIARELPALPLFFGGGTFAYRDAAYDRWVTVPGTGILDKRSFLRGAATEPPAAEPPVADLIDPSGDGGISVVPVIVVLLVLAAGGGLWWARRRA